MMSDILENIKKHRIHRSLIALSVGNPNIYPLQRWVDIILTYELPVDFKDLNPDKFISMFIWLIDIEKMFIALTEKLYELFLKIKPYTKKPGKIYIKNLDLYKLCVDAGYQDYIFYSDYKMTKRFGVTYGKEVFFDYRHEKKNNILDYYLKKYLTTI